MVVDEEQMECLAAYAAWQYALTFVEQYTREQRAEWKQMFFALKAVVNGRKIIREFKLQKGAISLIANAVLIQNRRGGY